MILCEIGLPRTGTRSLAKAMEILGHSVQHGTRGLEDDDIKDISRKLLFGQTDLDLYNKYDFVGDLPRIHWEELAKKHDDLRFVVTVRNKDEWWRSCWLRWKNTRRFKCKKYATEGVPIHALPAFMTTTKCLGSYGLDEAVWRKGYDEYYRRTAKAVYMYPANRFLFFNVKQGWEPLCQFLGKEVPDVEFPNIRKS